jgi:hypothetical protein
MNPPIHLSGRAGRFLTKQTSRRPLIMPVILEI